MNKFKNIYIDLYRPIFTNTGLSIKEVKHLKKVDIYTEVSIQKIVFTLRQLIFDKYGDGLYIIAEEFDSFCYLNVHIYFGEDISTLIDYLHFISKDVPEVIEDQTNELDETDEEVSFLSFEWAAPEEIKDYELTINSSKSESKRYLVGQSAFERGAGDYHQFFIFIIGAIATGALSEIGKCSYENIINLIKNEERVSVVEFNPKIVIDYVVSISGVNRRNLRITKISPINNKEVQINVSSRYKNFCLEYNKTSKSITSYQESDKTQTMI
ncbi:hypothetical protein [Ruoffia tabacinasalis]|uniref:Uncharacterized protein n=1 Tax=Ruoffia tabacinasalis TaxID=87458 RepID=A0ABS0LL59_9LACT|nr:hypothetical protein [Ruoffia tabacinasalis]MBG9978874.1 hypothetical protein [Ruoffia tabacinasalis]